MNLYLPFWIITRVLGIAFACYYIYSLRGQRIDRDFGQMLVGMLLMSLLPGVGELLAGMLLFFGAIEGTGILADAIFGYLQTLPAPGEENEDNDI